eukprot:gnl/MRDRNA2_/MRDRNA2_80948_c0_seq1.p1 gnl/MRDRNA2_/MRDRNA2_80948_c0~~gnl/MRDRNA2_/MRDRNA2_80948_c0_seq1.p1  ORF type:complete len:363 (+),score=67.30 gnl/MRDRNA2_/MRDRNA2_80948_c0_seq1:77-1090(+)
MAEQYYQVPANVSADGVGAQNCSSRRWFRVGVAVVGGSCLMLLCIVVASTSAPIGSSAPQSTSLLRLTPSLRYPSVGGVKSGIMKRVGPLGAYPQRSNMQGIGSSPLQELAMTAIEANQRDISVKAASDKLKDELLNMDQETRADVEKMEEAVKMKARDMVGVTAPMGFFDPLGFSTDLPEGRLLFYREVEIKHGRVAMLASLGFLVGEQFHPLFGGNIDVPSYIAFQETPLQTFWPAVLAAIAIPEWQQIKTFNFPFGKKEDEDVFYIRRVALKDPWSIQKWRVPGDFGFDPLGLKPTNEEEFKEMQTKEINNGRLAMIAAAGMVAQELATGQKLF